ncbi:ABC transporter ATP-binding protein [Lignipirellula cremea]|uniref:Putative ABC transporter ATP-binding protein YbhF n=1 Tax=Lignipirellula cremea TaxID=2528010 RepID=A0A518DWH3_9BACT|nr:ATP-binding cassette domain-containing protein [Lignipirellula cremea]QDU96187.1 putative ABC transporter ATP-binding protein YbhF [Lignipirellula cremea]
MITVHELTKLFTLGRTVVTAVDKLSFEVQAGEVYGLMGPNGAGKTTTLRMILGLLKPDSGYAEVAGVRTLDAPDEVKACVGFVSTSAGLYQWLTPRELLMFYADLYAIEPVKAAAQAERLSELFGLSSFLDRGCANLSTGQKQRVNLARALMHDPPVMLLDEPTRGLDIHGSKVIFDYVALLREQGKAVIVSTHRLDEAQRLCDRFGLLENGRLHQEGTLDQLRAATGCDSLVEMFLQYVSSTPREDHE